MWTQIRQEQSDLDLHCLSKRFQNISDRQQKQTTFVIIGTLRVNKCEFIVYTVKVFMNWAAQTTY